MEKLDEMQLNTERKLLESAEQVALMQQLPLWRIEQPDSVRQLVRSFNFSNFNDAMVFANRVAALADASNHHPSLLIEWGKTTVSWWTHNLRGLQLNDFILASRCDRIYAD